MNGPRRCGACGDSALVFALTSMVQRDLRAMLRSSILMHGTGVCGGRGGRSRASCGGAFRFDRNGARDCGPEFAVDALEARAGSVGLIRAGGRARAFPRLAASFALFGAAGVGMRGRQDLLPTT